jgi:signal transduction histidine kinase
VSNAVRHAQATRIEIAMRGTPLAWQLTVRDDGVGLAADSLPGLGLQIMEHRAELLGGALAVHVDRRGGTVVACQIPHADDTGVEGGSRA